MNRREIILAAGGLVTGGVLASGVWSVRTPPPPVRADPSVHDGGADDMDSLRKANENLVESLHQADQTIAQLREQLGSHAPPVASAKPDEKPDPDAGFRRRSRGEPTAEDWERMAQLGTVRVRMPCLRDTPWAPSQRVLDRLGLAPHDAETIKAAYASSNKRMTDVIQPLCAKTLGSAEAATRVGPKACAEAILSGAKRGDPEGMQKSIVRVAEANAGKDVKPAGDAAETLLLAMTKETKAFEAELASKLGPEEAKRLAYAPEMCTDRSIVRGKDREDGADDDAPNVGRRRGRGNNN